MIGLNHEIVIEKRIAQGTRMPDGKEIIDTVEIRTNKNNTITMPYDDSRQYNLGDRIEITHKRLE